MERDILQFSAVIQLNCGQARIRVGVGPGRHCTTAGPPSLICVTCRPLRIKWNRCLLFQCKSRQFSAYNA